MARARKIEGLKPGLPYDQAARRIVATRSAELFEHSNGVLEMADIEPLHDMRVATRRLRAALEVFAPCFPKQRHRRVLADVNELADALGQRRDRDVSIAFLEPFLEPLPAAERRRLQKLLSDLRAEQKKANSALALEIAEDRLPRLRRALSRMVKA
jgi:CHAD domain-containing protein